MHDPSDAHSHRHAPVAATYGASLLRASALLRLAGAGGLSLLLWLGAIWAMR